MLDSSWPGWLPQSENGASYSAALQQHFFAPEYGDTNFGAVGTGSIL